jgi:hypothetical protein
MRVNVIKKIPEQASATARKAGVAWVGAERRSRGAEPGKEDRSEIGYQTRRGQLNVVRTINGGQRRHCAVHVRIFLQSRT